ncbi:MAG: hypothetical protein LBD06_11190 [Candidatus Accumulibacter sp.]|nr:hypothetical protein [Accumulibacter sp.]
MSRLLGFRFLMPVSGGSGFLEHVQIGWKRRKTRDRSLLHFIYFILGVECRARGRWRVRGFVLRLVGRESSMILRSRRMYRFFYRGSPDFLIHPLVFHCRRFLFQFDESGFFQLGQGILGQLEIPDLAGQVGNRRVTIDENEDHPYITLDDAGSLLNRVFTRCGLYVDEI